MRSSLDMLCRVYPHMKRSLLQIILHSCHGDVIQAIEHVKRTHGDAAAAQSKSDLPSTSLPDFPFLAPGRSAFSPIMASLGFNPAVLRYAYANAAASMGGSAYPNILPHMLPPLAGSGTMYPFPGLAESTSQGLLSQLGSQCVYDKPCNLLHHKQILAPAPSIIELSGNSHSQS